MFVFFSINNSCDPATNSKTTNFEFHTRYLQFCSKQPTKRRSKNCIRPLVFPQLDDKKHPNSESKNQF